MKLSVLDHSQIAYGENGVDAVANTLQVAKTADQLGYERIWFSEHHSLPVLQGASPEVLMAAVGAQTTRIRVGSGGVMMANHSALHVAENFRMLEALYPGRIDCGLGRAGGGDQFVQSLLRGDPEGFEWQLNTLELFLHDAVKGAKAHPRVSTVPPVWLLSAGGRPDSGKLAASLGLGLAVALFINPDAVPECVTEYRKHFVPSAEFPAPQVIIAFNCICSDSPDKLAQLKKVSDYFRIRRDTGNYLTYVPSPEEINQVTLTPDQISYLDKIKNRQVVGSPEQVKAQIISRAKLYDADEVMMTMLSYDIHDKLNALRLIAAQFKL